jgi:RimJ/RimL family protein N-acetyltransferase
MAASGFETDELSAHPVEREDLAEVQAFIESNPEYWLLTQGHPPPSDEAAKSFDWLPPADMTYSEHLWLLVRHRSTQEVLGQLGIAADLLATGVYHLGFFMTATRTHGSGLAHRLHEAYERWTIGRGARWLRLGVVAANHRAEAFWRRVGYQEVRRRDGYVLGDLSHVLITMVKPLPRETLDEYLAAVPRDSGGAG